MTQAGIDLTSSRTVDAQSAGWTAITSPAKTVADCFKHRNKIGLDVAIEALRHFIKSRKGRAGLNELWRYAEIDRVQSVMRPYIEAMVS